MIQFTVDKKLLPVKLLTLLYYAGLACFIPYKSVFQKQLGVSSTQNGIIQATMMGVSFIAQPLAGAITDKTKAYRVILIVCLLLSTLFTVPMIFVPAVENEFVTFSCCNDTNIFCYYETIQDVSCNFQSNVTTTHDFGFQEEMFVNNEPEWHIIQKNCSNADKKSFKLPKCTDGSDVYGLTFFLLMILTVFLGFFLSPVNPLVDSTIMETLGKSRMQEYGKQRLWGAVGFGVVAFIVGYLIEAVSPPSENEYKNYLPSILSTAVFWILTCAVCLKLKVAAAKAETIFAEVPKLFKNYLILLFLFVVFICGFSTGVHYTYFFWYIESLKGATKTIMGVSVLITCASEIPMFFVSGYVCNAIGYVSVLSLGLIAIAIRFAFYTVVSNPWHVLFVEILHGISFALPLAAMCSYSALVAPKHLVATLITLSQAFYWGLGNMLGALIGGVLFDNFGGVWTFRITSILCASVAVFYWIVAHKSDRKFLLKKNKEESKNGTELSNLKKDETEKELEEKDELLKSGTETNNEEMKLNETPAV